MLTVLHISDLHFGPPFVPRVGAALLSIAPVLKPDVIVVTGDITQRAKPEQFAEASAFFDRLPSVPKVIVPGNHDIPLYRLRERIFQPYRWYREYIGDEHDHTLNFGNAIFAALNSTSPLRAIVNGRIESEQLDFCSQVFQEGPKDAIKVVVAHHHFAPAPDFERDRVMPKAKPAIDRFINLGVDVLLGGHLHRAYLGNSLNVYSGRDREHGIIIVQCGTTTSRRGRVREKEKNTFNLLKLDSNRVVVSHYMYFDDVDGFAPLSKHIFPRPGKPFLKSV
jgi:3',5'-cyclic AMP phosphodiesterase CpdA